MKNPFGKSVDIDSPYAVYVGPHNFEWRVLKTYQRPDKEQDNPHARWYVAVKSDLTFGSWEYGDTYIRDIVGFGTFKEATKEWLNAYTGGE